MRGGGLGWAVSTRTGPNDATRAPTTPTSHYNSLEPLRLRRQPKRPPTSHYDSLEPLRLRRQPKRPPMSHYDSLEPLRLRHQPKRPPTSHYDSLVVNPSPPC